MEKRKSILVIDDSMLIRKILFDVLQDEYTIFEAKNGVEAITFLKTNAGILSAVLLDLVMPIYDGFHVLRFMKEQNHLKNLPVLMITAEESEQYISKAYDLGVSEVIHKPFNPNVIKRRIHNLIDLYTYKNHLEALVNKQTEALKLKTQKLMESNEMMIDALSTVIEYRSLESGQHIHRIKGFTKILLRHISKKIPEYHLTADTIDMIASASALHDIGKIAIPDSVLLKPGKLTPEEFEIMKTHTTKGIEILYHLHNIDNLQYLKYCYDICLHHHERWDGLGYPDGLSRNQIPISAQAVSIADVYDALTHKRVYKPAYPQNKAAEMIINGECGTFSPALLNCFIQALPELKKLSKEYSD